jgi:hypothetical protein
MTTLARQLNFTDSEGRSIAPAEIPHPLVILDNAVRAGANMETLERISALADAWEQKEGSKRFNEALARFQHICPPIEKKRGVSLSRGGTEPDYKYAAFEDIMRAISPHLQTCGLSISFSASLNDAGMLTAECTVRCGTHSEKSAITMPVPAEMRVNATQKMGAAMSYAKRYALCNALNIVVTGEDMDARGLGEPVTTAQMAELNQLIEDTKTPLDKFLKWAGVDSLSEMSQGKFKAAIPMLNAKKKTGRGVV